MRKHHHHSSARTNNIISMVLYAIGFVLLTISGGWKLLLGVFMFMWAHQMGNLHAGKPRIDDIITEALFGDRGYRGEGPKEKK